MAVIFQTNKKTGITYAYQNEPYWDKEKQQSRAKRTLIGKVDPVTGEIIPTRSYKKKPAPTQAKEMPLGQNVDFGKNGLVKKKNYKYLRNKPNRKKYK